MLLCVVLHLIGIHKMHTLQDEKTLNNPQTTICAICATATRTKRATSAKSENPSESEAENQNQNQAQKQKQRIRIRISIRIRESVSKSESRLVTNPANGAATSDSNNEPTTNKVRIRLGTSSALRLRAARSTVVAVEQPASKPGCRFAALSLSRASKTAACSERALRVRASETPNAAQQRPQPTTNGRAWNRFDVASLPPGSVCVHIDVSCRGSGWC